MINKNSILVFCIMTVTLSGCAKELSSIPDVSIKKSYHSWGGYSGWYNGECSYENESIADVIQNSDRCSMVISEIDISQGFDFIIYADSSDDVIPNFRKGIEATFGLTVKKESRQVPVYILKKSDDTPFKMEISNSQNEKPNYHVSPSDICKHLYQLDTYLDLFKPYEPTRYSFKNYTMSDLAFWLEGHLKIVVIDSTNLTGSYNFELIEDKQKDISLFDCLAYFGLRVDEEIKPVEAIFIEQLPDFKSPVKFKHSHGKYFFYPAWLKCN